MTEYDYDTTLGPNCAPPSEMSDSSNTNPHNTSVALSASLFLLILYFLLNDVFTEKRWSSIENRSIKKN